MYTSKKLVFLAQFFISALMAFLMSGIMGYLHGGLSENWHTDWATAFITAWPIAFCLSIVVGPVGFRTAMFVLKHLPEGRA